MTTPGERLKAVRERSGFATAKEAAIAMGVPYATYQEHEAAVKHIPARRADEYAAYFKVTPEYLLYGRGEPPARIPIHDYLGQDTGRTTAPPPAPSTLTRALAGDGIAYPDFVALYNHPTGDRPPLDFEGRLCVVAIECKAGGGSERMVRIVQRGSVEGRYHLIAAGMVPLVNHEVLWIAPVLALVPV